MTSATIFAPATAAGPAGIAVVRVSGPDAGAALARLTGREPPVPRVATRVRVRTAAGETLDDGLAIWFPAPRSFTGEDTAELHLHGGRAVVAGVLGALAACPGLRPAEAGEFARRAFEHGKLDLTATEGLADLVAAETAAQRRQAVRQMRGELGQLYESWRGRLLTALAHIEAAIDFADEDLPDDLPARVSSEVAMVSAEIGRHLEDGHRGERLRDGVTIAIVGPPNAGKSSVLNRLARRDAAIVSETAGTTRDVIEVHLDLAGYPVIVADTAGLREAEGEIEREGVRRARSRAAASDLRLAVFDGAAWPETDAATRALVDGDTVVAVNKCDLGRIRDAVTVGGWSGLAVSALTGEGMEALVSILERRVAERLDLGGGPALTRVRHRAGLEACAAALDRYHAAPSFDLAAEEVRLAARALGRITGRVDVEEVLDVIFRDFCIGK